MPIPSTIKDLSTTASSNSPAGSDSIGNPGTIDDYFRAYAAISRSESLNKGWERWNDTPSYVGATQFSVATDLTSRYTAGRRVKIAVTAGTVYGYITASAYSSVTTVTVALSSGSIDSGISEVQLAPDTNAIPALASGSFTPNLSNATNCTSLSVNKAFFMRVGSIVQFSISASLTVTNGATSTSFNFTLPVSSDVSPSSGNVMGHALDHQEQLTGNLSAYSDDTGQANWTPATSGMRLMTIVGNYIIQ